MSSTKSKENPRRSIFGNWSLPKISPFSRRRSHNVKQIQERNANGISITNPVINGESKSIKPEQNCLNNNTSPTNKIAFRRSLAKFNITDDSSIIESLYIEALYTILHPIGCEVNQKNLFLYVQDAFEINNDRHVELLDITKKKEKPLCLLNVQVTIVEDQVPITNFSGMKLKLISTSRNKLEHTWTMKTPTEKCTIITNHNPCDVLELTLWEDDKNTNVIGKTVIPFQKLHASKSITWYKFITLQEYTVEVGISLSYKEHDEISLHNHKYLRKILVQYELSLSEIVPYWWSDITSLEARQILLEHTTQNGLAETSIDLCSFLVYAEVHQTSPLSFTVFSRLLQNLVDPIQKQEFDEPTMILFWKAVKSLIPSCFSIVKTIRVTVWSQNAVIKQVSEVLKILNCIEALSLARSNRKFLDEEQICDISQTLIVNITNEANKWLTFLLEKAEENSATDVSKIKNLIQVCQVIQEDLEKAVNCYNDLFIKYMEFNFAKHLYIFYEEKISTLLESEVKQISKTFKKIHYLGCNSKKLSNTPESSIEEPLSGGKLLFSLYMNIQKFVNLGINLFQEEFNFNIGNFHKWFHGAVVQWLDVEAYTALARIERVIKNDRLMPCGSSVNYSSSAVDTMVTFYQIKFMWERLKWPNLESSCDFILKIIDDIICKCSIYYADMITTRLETRFNGAEGDECENWGLAVNNVTYIKNVLKSFISDLGLDDIIKELSKTWSQSETEHYKSKYNEMINKTIDLLEKKTNVLLHVFSNKIKPTIKKLIIESADDKEQPISSMDMLMMYIDDNFLTLKKILAKKHFEIIVQNTWQVITEIFAEIIKENSDKNKPPSFYVAFKNSLKELLDFFKNFHDFSNSESLKETMEKLGIFGLDTPELIHQVNLKTYDHLNCPTETSLGELSLKYKFDQDSVVIKVIKARIETAISDTINSFIIISLLPSHKFPGTNNLRTKTRTNNFSPTFDETFTIKLKPDQLTIKDGLILFSVRHREYLKNHRIGEAMLKFEHIPRLGEKLRDLAPVQIRISKPTNVDVVAITALESRITDNRAKEFLKDFKQRTNL